MLFLDCRSFGRLAVEFVELLKARIVVLVLAVVGCSYAMSTTQVDLITLAQVAFGTVLVAGSGSVLNQVLESLSDQSMRRTSGRPLAKGRFWVGRTGVLGGCAGIGGVVFLAFSVGLMAGVFSLLTWLLYVFFYTPMKSKTVANTAIGALSGSMPVLIGWAASGCALDWRILTLFTVIYLWQLPHFMAIGWLYRCCYSRAGTRVVPAIDDTGLRAGLQAVVAAGVLIPVSMVPWFWRDGLQAVLIPVFVLGVLQWWCSVKFFVARDEGSARQLFRASLLYLPGFLAFVSIG